MKSDVIVDQDSTFEIVTPRGSEKPAIFIGNEDFKNQRASELNIEGMNFIKNGEYLNAEKKFIEALKQEPDNPTILNNLGNLTKNFGDSTKALEFYKKSIILSDSTYFNALYNLGLTYCNMNRFRESEEVLKYILKNFNNENQLSATNFVLTNVYLALEDCNKAQIALNQTKSFYENNPAMIENFNKLKKKVQNCSK